MTKIAIDAGHGSTTSGKRTPDGYREHWINVKCAYYCEQLLKANGYEVVRIAWNDLNAQDDADVALSTRQRLIKEANADYSVSFHANAYGSGWNNANGVETLIHCDSVVVKDSKAFATYIQNNLIKGTKQTNRGVKTQSLAMCNCNAMRTKASCLVEIAFMTNKAEADLMKTENFCKEQGEDVARGIMEYIKSKVPTTKTSNTTVTNLDGKYIFNGVDYNLVFDANFYCSKYQDLKNAYGNDATKLFNHFIQYGITEGRQGNAGFNVYKYMDKYPDLKKAFRDDIMCYYLHYIQYGYKEGRKGV